MPLIDNEPSELALTREKNGADLEEARGREQWDAAIAPREGQMGGHDNEIGSGFARPPNIEDATVLEFWTRSDTTANGENEGFEGVEEAETKFREIESAA
jgi:hypothetical protein